ncbi:hypothetical protein L1887_59182 [Cichorium endivia]|nr:hypothetical protein L1887_59182 [Cichorium endivia]
MNIVGSDVKGALRALWPDDLSPILTSPTAPQMQHLYEPTALRGGVLTLLCQKGCAPDFLCRYAFQIRAAHVAGCPWRCLVRNDSLVDRRRAARALQTPSLRMSARTRCCLARVPGGAAWPVKRDAASFSSLEIRLSEQLAAWATCLRVKPATLRAWRRRTLKLGRASECWDLATGVFAGCGHASLEKFVRSEPTGILGLREPVVYWGTEDQP